jgi:hypothetical protein
MDKNYLCSELKTVLELSNSLLLHKKQTTKFRDINVIFWPLFLEDTKVNVGIKNENDVLDSCATSEGLIAFNQLNINNLTVEEEQIINDAIVTIILMRNNNGSWPSFQNNEFSNKIYLEGIINDTCFAINALMDIGFLSLDFKYLKGVIRDKKIVDLSNIEYRLKFILESTNWLIDNRVNNGWYYTGKEKIDLDSDYSPCLSPSISAVNTLYKVKNDISNLTPHDKNIISDLNNVIASSIRTIYQMQAAGGSFGKQRGDYGKIAHTCLALITLLTISNTNEIRIMDTIGWLVNNKRIMKLDELNPSESFDEYFQIKSDDNKDFKKRSIHHENFVDALLLHSFVQVSISLKYYLKLKIWEKYKFSILINYFISNILKKQIKQGSLAGAFLSRRAFPNELYPIYTIEKSTTAIALLLDNIDIVHDAIEYRRKIFIRLSLSILILPVIYFLINYWSKIESNMSKLWMTIIIGILCNFIYDLFRKLLSSKKK